MLHPTFDKLSTLEINELGMHVANDFLNEEIIHISATMLVVNQRCGPNSLDPHNDFIFT